MSLASKEGEEISSLIGGYIDIVLKRRKDGESVYTEDAAGELASEEVIAKPSGGDTNLPNMVRRELNMFVLTSPLGPEAKAKSSIATHHCASSPHLHYAITSKLH